jgi:hypothetical protein
VPSICLVVERCLPAISTLFPPFIFTDHELKFESEGISSLIKPEKPTAKDSSAASIKSIDDRRGCLRPSMYSNDGEENVE